MALKDCLDPQQTQRHTPWTASMPPSMHVTSLLTAGQVCLCSLCVCVMFPALSEAISPMTPIFFGASTEAKIVRQQQNSHGTTDVIYLRVVLGLPV